MIGNLTPRVNHMAEVLATKKIIVHGPLRSHTSLCYIGLKIKFKVDIAKATCDIKKPIITHYINF